MKLKNLATGVKVFKVLYETIFITIKNVFESHLYYSTDSKFCDKMHWGYNLRIVEG